MTLELCARTGEEGGKSQQPHIRSTDVKQL